MKPCLYILLPVHNRREITRDFIDYLEAQTWQNYHLVLIDDESTDSNGPDTNFIGLNLEILL